MFGGEGMQRRMNVQPRFWVFLIGVMLLCFTLSFVVGHVHYRKTENQVLQLSTQKLALLSRITQLNSQLDYVQTDAYVQRVARDELNMIMPGEIRYVSN